MKQPDRLYGRIERFDTRSRAYEIRALAPATAQRTTVVWDCDTWLDQGKEGACTGFAVCHEAAALPVAIPNITDETGFLVYSRAREIGKVPSWIVGASVLDAVKAAREMEWITEFRWAFGEEDLAIGLQLGPAILGVNWYDGMDRPDSRGMIQVSGQRRGGHAILCRGYDAEKERYTLRNSWGGLWGVRGDCHLRQADMVRLLGERGEACIPLVRGDGKQEGKA